MYGLLLGILVAVVLFYHRASLAVWTISALLYYAAYLKWVGFHVISSGFFCAIILLLVCLQLVPLRRRFITASIFKMYQALLPPMSETEQEAIAAGSVTFEGDIFKGKPNWHALLKEPSCRLTDEERAFIDGPTETLCAMLNDWEITHERLDLPPHVWAFLKEQGFFGLIIPKRFGGKEFSAYAHSQIAMKVSGISVATSVTISVPNSLGPAELLLHYGTKEQQQYYLPRLANGTEIPCFALTSLDAGSDASAMTDHGVVMRSIINGQSILGIKLNFSKRYITLAPIATVIGLAFKLYDPEHLLGDQVELGITCALIPRDTPGVRIGKRHFPLNCPFQNGPIEGHDVFIPIDWIIGGAAQIGKGWRMLMECLAAGRAITLPSNALGGAKVLTLASGAYARIRSQFGLPIGRFEGIQQPLAHIAMYTYIMDAARQFTIAKIDAKEKPAIASAIVKYHVTEFGRKCVIHGMDIHGGKGICLGPNNYLGRGYQTAPIAITVEGANILTRNLIIFGQGLMRCHPYLYAEMQAAQSINKASGLKAFDHAFIKHIGFVLSNIARTIILSLTGARLVVTPKSRLRRYMQSATRFAAAFALLTDVAMLVYRAQLKRKENISARLGDIVSHLYLLSAVIKRFHEQGEQEADLPLVMCAADYCLYEVERAFTEILRNFHSRTVAILLRWLIFPFGRRFKAPTDDRMSSVAMLMQQDSTTRLRLLQGVSLNYPLFTALQDAMRKVIAAESIEKKVREAMTARTVLGFTFIECAQAALRQQIITTSEFEMLNAAEEARRHVLQVDAFSEEELFRRQSV